VLWKKNGRIKQSLKLLKVFAFLVFRTLFEQSLT